MKLREIILKNFRSFKNETRISVSNLTVFIGKNDIGKSTILEALEIFFNNSIVKIEAQDLCVHSSDQNIVIGCVFEDLPDSIILDATSNTSLKEEYLLNKDGFLEIHKEYICNQKTPKETVNAIANHPSIDKANDLLLLKNSELKNRIKELGINNDNIDQRSNPSIRSGIWNSFTELKLIQTKIPLNKEDAKIIWENLSKALPIYALFQADRPSKDEDAEVQDPMKLAISEAIKIVESDLERIKTTVQDKVMEVAERTLTKLKEIDPDLAKELSPSFKADPKWDGFKLSLTGDDQIPINKRGSGVRRLILLCFFRAEAERKQADLNSSSGIIYAIEEPETSQHPSNQRLIVESLCDLSEQENCQILITTHVPGLAGLLPIDSIRYVYKDKEGENNVTICDNLTLKRVADELGVIPDERVQVFVCVEGPHDISFLKNLSKILNTTNTNIPILRVDPRIVILPLGGSTLKDWVNNEYLKCLGKPEIHIYDRDNDKPSKYQDCCQEVNSRGDGSHAFLTKKREMENYLHPDTIFEVYGFKVSFGDDDDVPMIIAREVYNRSGATKNWDNLTPEVQKKKISKAKKRLNNEVSSKMTIERIKKQDPKNEIELWLQEISKHLR
jgi:putative ATP-dependent endonuclease of OLD family